METKMMMTKISLFYSGSSYSELILASDTGTTNKYSVSFDVHNDGPSPLGANLKIAVVTNKGSSDIVKVCLIFKNNLRQFVSAFAATPFYTNNVSNTIDRCQI